MAMRFIQALYDTDSEFPTNTNDYMQILKEILMFGVSSQIYFLLKASGKLEKTPQFFRYSLQQCYNQALYLNLFIKKKQEKVLKELNLEGVEVIPLKGTMFAEKYFGHLGARGTSDIDLLVKPHQLGKAVNCIKDLGFTMEEEQIQDHFHCSYSKNIPGSNIPLTIEFHWDIVKKKSANFDIKDFWRSSISMHEYDHVYELSAYHTFYMICLHGWRHNLDSPKYFIDIIQMIHTLGEEIDYDILFNEAKTHKTLNRLVRTLSIVYKQFPHLNKVRELPLKRSNLHWDYNAFTEKNKRTIKKYVDYIDYHVLSYDTPVHFFNEMLKK